MEATSCNREEVTVIDNIVNSVGTGINDEGDKSKASKNEEENFKETL